MNIKSLWCFLRGIGHLYRIQLNQSLLIYLITTWLATGFVYNKLTLIFHRPKSVARSPTMTNISLLWSSAATILQCVWMFVIVLLKMINNAYHFTVMSAMYTIWFSELIRAFSYPWEDHFSLSQLFILSCFFTNTNKVNTSAWCHSLRSLFEDLHEIIFIIISAVPGTGRATSGHTVLNAETSQHVLFTYSWLYLKICRENKTYAS